MVIRETFPKVYKLADSRTGNPYWLVDARSKKWGMNERLTFGTEKEALDRARAIAEQVQKFGSQSHVPKEKLVLADAYAKLTERLTPFDKTPEEAVEHYVRFLGDEIVRQAKPPIRDLVDQWQSFKFSDTTLSKLMIRDSTLNP